MLASRLRLRLSLALAVLLTFAFINLMPVTHMSILTRRNEEPFTVAEIFSSIYQYQIWGIGSADTPFFSGLGSHDASVVDPYVSAIRSFLLANFNYRPDAVDLGCGDFNVGRQIRNLTCKYTACDVVPGVIEYNRQAYSEDDVDFRVLDIVSEEPPLGDIVFLRQVLQHLGNDQISQFLPRLQRFKWAIITEHIPLTDPFTPNLDIRTGSVRLEVGSGVELTKEPFNLAHIDEQILSESLAKDGRIRTTAYRFQ